MLSNIVSAARVRESAVAMSSLSRLKAALVMLGFLRMVAVMGAPSVPSSSSYFSSLS
jgi:hypothetical protein